MLLIVALLRILILMFSAINNQQKIGEFYSLFTIDFIRFYQNYIL